MLEKTASQTEHIGLRIKQLREEKGLTARQLAKQAGISKSYVSQIELGWRRKPSVHVAMKLAQALGVSVYDIYGAEPTFISSHKDLFPLLDTLEIAYENEDLYIAIRSEKVKRTPRRLSLDSFDNGEYVVAKKNPAYLDGKLYLVRHRGKLGLRHYYRVGHTVRLVSPSGYEEATPARTKILGQVVMVGTWQKY